MIVTLSREEMLRCRRIAAGLEHLRTDCDVRVTDGIDVDAMYEQELRQWYLDFLDNGPAHLVAVSDVAATLRDGERVPGGGVMISVPPECRRVFSLRLDSWLNAVEVASAEKARDIISRQLNPYTAASPAMPVACLVPGAEAGLAGGIMAWPAGKLPHVTAAIDTGPGIYKFDEAAMNTIFDKKSVVR